MDTKHAKIYYMPPLSNRIKQIDWAQQLLESRGFKVKIVESRQLSSGERRALEQGGHTYPVVFLHDKFISIEQLERELELLKVPPSPKGTPIKQQASPMEFTFGASPPGPQNIFLPQLDLNSNYSPPRRFAPPEEVISRPADEPKAKHRSNPSPAYPFGGDPSSFGASGIIGDVLEEIDGEPMQIHSFGEQSAEEIFPTRPFSSSPQEASSSFNGLSISPKQPYVHEEATSSAPSRPILAEHGNPPKKISQNDPHLERLIWLFNGIKHYCESAEFQRAVNLLGKTADLVETQAKSIWSYLGWGGAKAEPANPQMAHSEHSTLPAAPPDTETTLTLLVVRTNWYGRDQYRFLRLDSTGFVRLRPDTFEEVDRTKYEQLVAAQVTGSTIKFRYHQGEALADIAYNFGDAEVARMIVEALPFLKGKDSVAVSYVGR